MIQLLLFAVPVILLFFYLEPKEDLGPIETVVTLSCFACLLVIARNKWDWFLWTIVILIVLAIGVTLSWTYWEVLHSEQDSVSTTVRNLGLLIGGVIAILLAVWRSIVAERQADTAQQSLMNERYQKGAEMIGNEVLSVRLGGIYALGRLAAEHPEEYHLQVMELFCEFVRHPTRNQRIEIPPENDQEQDDRTLRADVQNVMRVIGFRSPTGIALEQGSKEFKLYLRDANLSDLQVQSPNLSGAWLTNANLSGAILPRADLSSSRLRQATLCGAEFRHADLSDAKFWGANLSGAILSNANLSGADLCGADAHSPVYGKPVRGLTQAQLDEACADPKNQPKLDGVLDAETGEPLVWRGKPC